MVKSFYYFFFWQEFCHYEERWWDLLHVSLFSVHYHVCVHWGFFPEEKKKFKIKCINWKKIRFLVTFYYPCLFVIHWQFKKFKKILRNYQVKLDQIRCVACVERKGHKMWNSWHPTPMPQEPYILYKNLFSLWKSTGHFA